ncbi:pyruvate dehydrogenase E2 component [Vigna unguiculata]|uniref:Pyruvate dehydrogenase E2 component n=1 Tax=Vigna unguiculata TaxID=3917 RepID=A0A4D6LP34_VIGUN|nr:pyruvate dehydrogenase E2 component [Vigna unguiculata]
MTECKIVSLVKSEGDVLSKGDSVVVVESDKADMDVETFYDGILAAIVVAEGQSAPVGAPIGLLAKPRLKLPRPRPEPIPLLLRPNLLRRRYRRSPTRRGRSLRRPTRRNSRSSTKLMLDLWLGLVRMGGLFLQTWRRPPELRHRREMCLRRKWHHLRQKLLLLLLQRLRPTLRLQFRVLV